MTWIDSYLDYVSDTEPPESYHLWTAISCVAGAMRKRVYSDIGGQMYWPNFYICLVGPSGVRKGTALQYGKQIMKALKFPMGPDTVSGKEAFLHVLNNKKTRAEEEIPGLGRITHHSLSVFALELKTFLKNDHEFMANLTDLYDKDESFEYYTVKDEHERYVSWPFFNLLGGTTPEQLPTIFPKEVIFSGATSRYILIFADSNKATKSDPKVSDIKKRQLIRGLGDIAQQAGRVIMLPSFWDAYNPWYYDQAEAIRLGHPPIKDYRFGGYCNRRGLFVRKLAMVSMASRGSKLRIEAQDFFWAKNVLEEAEVRMPEIFKGQGQHALSDMMFRVSASIKRDGDIAEGDLLREFFGDLDQNQLAGITNGLVVQGQVEKERIDGKWIYRWKEKI